MKGWCKFSHKHAGEHCIGWPMRHLQPWSSVCEPTTLEIHQCETGTGDEKIWENESGNGSHLVANGGWLSESGVAGVPKQHRLYACTKTAPILQGRSHHQECKIQSLILSCKTRDSNRGFQITDQNFHTSQKRMHEGMV
jgi:hypothetical protein